RAKEARQTAGWTQEALAEAMSRLGHGWGRVSVAESESGVRRLSLEELLTLASLYGVPMVEFLLPPEDTALTVSDELDDQPHDRVRELVLGSGGRVGVGGTQWKAAAALVGAPRGTRDVRPAVDYWAARTKEQK